MPRAILGLFVVIPWITPSIASTLPWCSGGGESGVPSCGYSSFEQCRANARTCFQNPHLDQPASSAGQSAQRPVKKRDRGIAYTPPGKA